MEALKLNERLVIRTECEKSDAAETSKLNTSSEIETSKLNTSPFLHLVLTRRKISEF